MAFKVTKKYGKFAIIKDDWYDKYYIVDVLNGQSVTSSYYLKSLKWQAEALEAGTKTVMEFESKWNSDYLNPIDMPKSLKAQQAQLQKQAAKQAANQTAGAKYAIVEKDGKYLLVDTASSKALSNAGSVANAKELADWLESGTLTLDDISWNKHYMEHVDMTGAKIIDTVGGKPIGSKAPSIVNVTDKGAYKIVEMSDGTFGMFVPSTGQSKMGFTSKLGASMSGSNAAKKSATEVLAKQGLDPGANAVDTLIDLYEGRVREMYGQAYREMAAKQAKFLERYDEQLESLAKKHEAGELSSEAFADWRSSQAAMMQRNSQMVDALASDLATADKRAMQMLNGYMGPAYAENLAYETFAIEKQVGMSTSFSMHNRQSVEAVLKDPSIPLLPVVDDAADMAWCRQKVSSSIAQSILQGESVPNAAARLMSVVGMSANSAVRAARTALTGAQNLGRMDAARRAEAMGIKLKKQWIATADERTRMSHRALDREVVGLEDAFDSEHGPIDYPGDPIGDPAETYNCRCSVRFVLPGHEYDDLPEYTEEGIEYEEWKNAHLVEQEAKVQKLQSQIDAIDAQKADIMKSLPPDETYASKTVLKHETSLSKWEHEKAAIADSQKYYDKQMWLATSDDKMQHYMGKLKALEEYDAKGKAYHEAKQAVQGQLDALDKQKKEIGAQIAKLRGEASSAYSQERLNAARRFATSEEADRALRSLSGKAWQEATQAERRAINTYTGGAFDEYNIPLNGFKGSYRNYAGIGNVDIDDLGRGRDIREMTKMIERSITEEDMWLRRGVGRRTMSDFFGLEPTMEITSLSDEQLKSFVGMSNRIGSFQSCGTTFDTGFTHKPVTLEIFVPKGSEAMYVEPISKCGNGAGLRWDGVSPQHSLGTELETIIQRGGSYTCIDYKRVGGKPTFVLELHPEQGYLKFQQ